MITDRQGIEIDYCPKCRGVWLDRGELDKIIERTAGDIPPARPQNESQHRDHRDYQDYGKYPYKKKKNILGELFDF
jgi:Zn-finger nucleic acid-binding protein